LPFLSSNAATLADAGLAAFELDRLARAGIAVAATTFVAVDGAIEAFSPTVEALAPYPGVTEVCRLVRSLVDIGTRPPARLQDPFALRSLPQVHGLALDAVRDLAGVVEDGTCAWSENPAVDVAAGTLAHHGGFHAAYLASALDTARLAVAGTAGLALRRIAMLLDPALSGTAAFLGDGTAGASGAMGLEYAAGSALGDLRALAAPASVQTLNLSRGVEDDASFASLGARQALDARAAYAAVLGCELVGAVRAVRLRGLDVPAGGWGDVLELCGGSDGSGPEALSAAMADRDLTPDVEAATRLLPRLADLPPRLGVSTRSGSRLT
jgi:histidine ammonia-lyase